MKCSNCKFVECIEYEGIPDFFKFCRIKKSLLGENKLNCDLIDENYNLTKKGKAKLIEINL